MRPFRPSNNNGSIKLRFRVDGQLYIFSPIPGGKFDDPNDYRLAEAIAATIQADVKSGQFDPSLNKYRRGDALRKPPRDDEGLRLASAAPRRLNSTTAKSLLAVWDLWVSTLDLPPQTKADHYEMIRRMINRTKPAPALLDTEWFRQAEVSASTWNKRKGYLKACLNWAVEEGLCSKNPYATMKPRKVTKTKVKPFTDDEIRRILEEFSYRFTHYLAFVAFLMLTGVRTSEAIGLQWKHIDFARNEVEISSSLPKDRAGNGYTRVRKTTKTDNQRVLTLTDDLRTMLLSHRGKRLVRPEDLVFTSSWGRVIDAGNFRDDWKSVLAKLGIEYRKPYITRHTLASHGIQQGMSPIEVAYILGHSDTRMVMATYGHLINRPSLPALSLLPPDTGLRSD